MSFTGKVAIVTGAASGIGAATAKALAKEDAKVILVDKDEDKLKEVAKQCKDTKQILVIRADITKDEEIRSIVKTTVDHFGQIDILINNAGTLISADLSDNNFMERYDIVMNTNLRSMVYLTHLIAPYLIKTKGNIVNTSSIGALTAAGGSYLGYAVSKAGVSHFTRRVASDLAPHGVRVNAVMPGGTRTNILQNAELPNPEKVYEAWKDLTALKRIADPEEIADLILFLASDKAKSITGSGFVCDNGTLLKM